MSLKSIKVVIFTVAVLAGSVFYGRTAYAGCHWIMLDECYEACAHDYHRDTNRCYNQLNFCETNCADSGSSGPRSSETCLETCEQNYTTCEENAGSNLTTCKISCEMRYCGM